MRVRVLLLTQWFDPEPTPKGLNFARELVRQGFEVEVVTGFPNYPGGKIYPGYKLKLWQREKIDGVDITRVPLFPSHGHSVAGRVFNYISFAISSLLYGLFFAKRPQVIYVYHPPLTVGLTAAVIGFFRRRPIVYDIQDMWPDTLRATGMISNRRILKFLSKLCDIVYNRASQIVVLSPGFKNLLMNRGLPAEKIEIIYNWCNETLITESDHALPEGFPGSDQFRVLFAGNMGKAQALDAVLEAAVILQDIAPVATFVFVGGGIELKRLKQIACDKLLNNVTFLPPVPMNEIGRYLQSADVLLVHLKRDPLFAITIPSKTQAYLAAGKPILMAVDGDAADIIRKDGCGLTAEPENPQSIADAVTVLMQASVAERRVMAEKARLLYQQEFSLSIGCARFGVLFKRLSVR